MVPRPCALQALSALSSAYGHRPPLLELSQRRQAADLQSAEHAYYAHQR